MKSKGIWPKQILDKLARKYPSEGRLVPKPALLWRKVAKGTDNHRLLIAAYYNLAGDNSNASRELIRAKLKSGCSKKIKVAIIKGLGWQRPIYSSEVLIEDFPRWKHEIGPENEFMAYTGLSALAAHPSDSQARRFLRKVILDSDESLELRTLAISVVPTMRGYSDLKDISCFVSLLKSSAPASLKRTAAYNITRSKPEIAQPIINKLLETENDQSVIDGLNEGLEELKRSAERREKWKQAAKQKEKSKEGKMIGEILKIFNGST